MSDITACDIDYRPPAPEPPSRRLSPIRLLQTLARNPIECWSADFFSEPMSKVRLPFTTAVVVNEPNAIKRVLLDNADNYDKDPIQRRILSVGLAEGLLSAEGERWELQRRTLAPLFAKSTVTSFATIMLGVVEQRADQWAANAGETIDIAIEMTTLTLQILAATIFSDGIVGGFDEFRTAMNDYFSVIGRIDALDLLGLPRFIPRAGRARLKKTMSYFEGVIDEIIDARRRRLSKAGIEENQRDLLTLLLQALDPSTGRPMTLTEVKSNILTFLSAGHETTANTLTWAIFLLSQSTDWTRRVQEEVDREMKNPDAGFADRLVATRAVIDEALRLYPPIAALSRVAKAPDVLDGTEIPRRALIVIAPYVLHRHRRLWDRPDIFDPSRFMPQEKRKIARFTYLPFGAGPRTCIGSSFALQEAVLVLAVLMRRFNIELRPERKIWPRQQITLRPANGVLMSLTPRA